MFAPITTQQQRQSEYVTVTLPVVPFSSTPPDMNSKLDFSPHTVPKFIFCGMKVYNV